jgi:fructose-bisphosphate aldolase, class II
MFPLVLEDVGMEPFADEAQLRESLQGVIRFKANNQVDLLVPRMLRAQLADRLVWTAVFGSSDRLRKIAMHIIREAAHAEGIWCSSITNLLTGFSKTKKPEYTIPAITLRGMTYTMAKAVFRVAKKMNAGPFIFSISPSEMQFTRQRPEEYSACILGAALRENYRGPVYLKGSQFKVAPTDSMTGKQACMQSLFKLISEAIHAGFFNFEMAGSMLNKSEKKDPKDLFSDNLKFTAESLEFIRHLSINAEGVTTGSELGDITRHRFSHSQLSAYVTAIKRMIKKSGLDPFQHTITVQCNPTKNTDLSDPNSPLRQDLELLQKLTRETAGLAGVNVYTSIVPGCEFYKLLADIGVIEAHFGPRFQSLIFDHSLFPSGLSEDIHYYLDTEFGKERDPAWTDEQFFHKYRTRAWGQFKRTFWSFDERTKIAILNDVEREIESVFTNLNLADTWIDIELPRGERPFSGLQRHPDRGRIIGENQA